MLDPNASLADYFLLEDPSVVARLRAEPQGFLDAVSTPAILNEVQHVPEIFGFVRARIDQGPRRGDQWLLTGSQEAPLFLRAIGAVNEAHAQSPLPRPGRS
jgi:predicted AAA+ superfamily ATPase